jgi:hypothetical protein
MNYHFYFKSKNKYSLKIFKKKINNLLGLIVPSFHCLELPKNKQKITVFRSTHVNKKSKEQFEICTYKFLIKIKTEKNLLQILLACIINKIPQDISIEVTKENLNKTEKY